MRKKKFRFLVKLKLEELDSVPFVNGLIFVKIRLLQGGNFTQLSSREEVKDHVVTWKKQYLFDCKINANASTGVLESTKVRLSVRKESRSGKACQKLGFVELDLVEFAGCGETTKIYLLEGYNTKKARQDNSTLKVTVLMNLLSADPLFIRPSTSIFYTQHPIETGDFKSINVDSDNANAINSANDEDAQLKLKKKGADNDCYSGGSVSSGLGSLPCSFHQHHPPLLNSPEPIDVIGTKIVNVANESNVNKYKMAHSLAKYDSLQLHLTHPASVNISIDQFELGHTRNSSNLSQQSKVSVGYGSLPSHSRQSSTESEMIRNLNQASEYNDSLKFNSTERKQRMIKKLIPHGDSHENRVDSTRIDSLQLINQLVKETNLEKFQNQNEQELGLKLYVAEDGTTTLGSCKTKTPH